MSYRVLNYLLSYSGSYLLNLQFKLCIDTLYYMNNML